MIDWLPGYERIEITGCTGPGIPQFGNWSITLHTMEGPIEAAINGVFIPKPCYCPHLSIAPRKGRKVQHVPLSWPSAALANQPGGVETNRAREIQIEIEGRAAESHTWPDGDLKFIGGVLADIVRAGVPINLGHHPQFVGEADGFIARVDAPQRFSPDAWYAFDGVCGHQHVPENEHWDPGRLNIARVIEHARASLGETNQEDDVTPEQMKELKDEINKAADAAARNIMDNNDGTRPHTVLAAIEHIDALPGRLVEECQRVIDTLGSNAHGDNEFSIVALRDRLDEIIKRLPA